MAAHNTRPIVTPVPESPAGDGLPALRAWAVRLARAVNLILRGKLNATGTVTLAAGGTSTTLTDDRIGYFSTIVLTATTAHAAATTGLYVVAGDGAATITHNNTADTDRTFTFLVVG